MTATVAADKVVRARRVPVSRGYRFELVKLVSQWRIRLLVLACWIAPALFVAGVSRQSTLPVDTLFGRWMHATGWAGPLVMLGFAGTWALPLLTSLVAGDVFASEDRLGTWRHLLVAVRSPRRIFVASLSDVFHEAVPDDWIDRIFTVMALARRHTFQLLTKRPERMLARELIEEHSTELANAAADPLILLTGIVEFEPTRPGAVEVGPWQAVAHGPHPGCVPRPSGR